jgi:DcaP outer membrane protein
MSIPLRRLVGAAAALLGVATGAGAQAVAPQATEPTPAAKRQARDTATKIEVYGFAQADAIYQFKQSNPDWFDTNRPSRLPAFDDEFGRDGRTWISARQSKIGVKATIPTSGPDIKAVFEWDLFGVGADEGQFTIRPRHIWGQWGQFGAGQTNSVFMDVDIFPNTLEYWGPNGMLFFRNMMVFWQPVNRADGTRFTLALERAGASGDAGVYADRIELQNVRPRFPAPDITSEYRYGGGFGYVELAGIVRWIAWDDLLVDEFDLSGSVTGWGVSLSSNLKAGKNDVFRLQGIYGAGVENYFNDAPIDVGLKSNFDDPITPVTGEALKNFGLCAYLDHRWTSWLTSAIGYARVDIDNSDLQEPTAFKSGQYASVNLLWTPASKVLIGGEFLWGNRQNFSNGYTANDYRLQFSFRYSFSQTFGGNGHDPVRAED